MTSAKTWPLLLLPFSLISMGKAECPYPSFNGNIVLSSESRLKNEFPDNSEITVECSRGHEKKEGSPVVTCVNGNWSPVQLICQKIDCGLPVGSPHMKFNISGGTLFGAQIKAECERRYDLEGSSYWQCLVSGWRGRSKCTLITCDDPGPIDNGKKDMPNATPEMDDVITYSCDENYTLVGNQSITCLEYEYNLPPPKCELIVCPVPEIEFGNRIEGNPPYLYKSRATFECRPGYSMKGSASAVCEETGWSALPVCEVSLTSFTTEKSSTAAAAAATTSLSSTTTTTATTTTASTANTHLREKLEKELTTPLQNNGATIIAILIVACTLAILIILVVPLCVWHNNKHRGSYSTGEEQRTTKEELFLYQSL